MKLSSAGMTLTRWIRTDYRGNTVITVQAVTPCLVRDVG